MPVLGAFRNMRLFAWVYLFVWRELLVYACTMVCVRRSENNLQERVLTSCYARSRGLSLVFRLEARALTCWATSLLTSTLKGQFSLCLCATGIYNDNDIIIFIPGMKSLDSCISRLFAFIGNHSEEVRVNQSSELKKARQNCWKNKRAI